jgi:hypothetical protein
VSLSASLFRSNGSCSQLDQVIERLCTAFFGDNLDDSMCVLSCNIYRYGETNVRRKDLSAAIWRPEHGVAEVVLLKGKLFSHMGFVWGSKLFLHIEEVL